MRDPGLTGWGLFGFGVGRDGSTNGVKGGVHWGNAKNGVELSPG
jgi:hypothetical protein